MAQLTLDRDNEHSDREEVRVVESDDGTRAIRITRVRYESVGGIDAQIARTQRALSAAMARHIKPLQNRLTELQADKIRLTEQAQ